MCTFFFVFAVAIAGGVLKSLGFLFDIAHTQTALEDRYISFTRPSSRKCLEISYLSSPEVFFSRNHPTIYLSKNVSEISFCLLFSLLLPEGFSHLSGIGYQKCGLRQKANGWKPLRCRELWEGCKWMEG